MYNIFDYLDWRGDLTFEQDEINEVDAVILARLSYIAFENIVPTEVGKGITLKEAVRRYFDSENSQKVLWDRDPELLKALEKSKRFSELELSGFTDDMDYDIKMQFSAVIISINPELHYISYRGTDNSVIGWQEDFNMYCMFPLHSQTKAVDYFEKASALLNGSFILGGHSKGGNLAVYAAAFCNVKYQDRIASIYNYDGPGFTKKAIKSVGYQSIKDRVHTFVPQSSIFGMMLEHEEEYTIVKSNQKGFMQHDVYSWEIMCRSFAVIKEIANTSVFIGHIINSLMDEMTVEQRREFIDGVFSLIERSDDKTFDELAENWRKNSYIVFKAVREMDKSTRQLITGTIFKIILCAKNNFSDINPISNYAGKNGKKHRKITVK